ncbi:MAG TPA: amino acid adenylation domain-containing protein, partial [Thermoanaerobaculia bacterium]|nr:amino acid adenylation domain-containing protein [Thermoanaerobaculia bacterium]
EVALRQVFELPTVGELARAVRSARQAGSQVPLVRVPRDGQDLPLSFAQQRLWLIDQLEPGSPAYNIPLAVRLTGTVEPGRVERIFARVVARHEALRTTFETRDGRPVQVIAPELRPHLPVVDLSQLPAAEREAQALRLARAETRRPFDLQRGPLLRLALVRLDERDHVLLMTMHHIVSDGWSMGVLLREIAAFHGGLSLPDLAVQYADFAVWQRGWLEGEVLASQLEYWQRQLADAPQVLELPTDRPRPPLQSFRGARLPLVLPAAELDGLKAFFRAHGATLFMGLLAAWQALLHRHTGQDEIVVGSPVANRGRVELEPLIGFFANTLVLRTGFEDAPSFAGLLARVRKVAADAYAHQDVPLERLVEELQPERHLGITPLFQVMLVLQNAPVPDFGLADLTMRILDLDPEVARFDLLLNVTETADGRLDVLLEYSTDLFDDDRIARLLQHFRVLLAGAAAEPERPVSELPLLTREERDRLLYEWNDRAADAETRPHIAVHEPVEEQAERTPDALAVLWVDGTDADSGLTYGELDRRANRLARHLRVLGVGPDERVSICLERSLDLLVAVLGVLKAGGAYVPIDPDYPADRVAFMLADSRSRVLITSSTVAARLPELPEQGVRPVLLDADRDAIAARSAAAPARWSVPENLAYVIYTSGSTGRPKGVAMPHGAVANMLAWQRGASAAGLGSRTLQFASLSFDVSFQEIFSSWWTGGTVVVVPQETRRDAMALSRLLHEREVDRLFLPFVALQQLAEAVDQGAPLPAALAEVCTAGEQLRITRQITAWMERSGTALENHYGPSEGHAVTAHRLTGPPGGWPALPPIGRPLANVRIYLLDPGFEPVPQGVAGHLCFGGVQVVRGYLDRPQLTAEKFVPDPFAREPGARLYGTGDLARYLADGTLQFQGRIDHQVKIRGFRVEPGEVEAALARHPAVEAAAVVVRGEGTERRLVGFYVAGSALSGDALRASLKEELPEYMVPAALVRLDALPLTPSGKVDRRALPEDLPDVEEGQASGAAADPVEELLAGIWAEVLRRDRVGVHQDFFALGGHSLLATQVMSRIRGVLGVDLPLRQLFEAPTVAGLAQAARAVRESREGAQAPPIVPVLRDGDLPLSFAQQRLWFLDQLEPGSTVYNMPLAVRLTGEVEPARLARIFAEIVRRHEALRTTFASRAGKPVQEIASPRVELPVLDLSQAGAPVAESEALRLAREEALRPFDLARGPLLRLALVRLGERDHVLLMTMHHIVSDGWSMGVLLREIGALYEGSPLPELPVQYADFAVWQRSWLEGEVLEAQIAYWRGQLAGAPQVLELPADRPRPAMQTFRGASLPLSLPAALSERVRALCRREGATPFMALLAAWSALL